MYAALTAAASSANGSACHCSLFKSAPNPDGDANEPCFAAGASSEPSMTLCWFAPSKTIAVTAENTTIASAKIIIGLPMNTVFVFLYLSSRTAVQSNGLSFDNFSALL